MLPKQWMWAFAILFITVVLPLNAYAGGLGISSSPLVDHPVLHPSEGRSSAAWRKDVGMWGENFTEETLRLRGFNEIHEIKTGANQGIDRIAIKRSTRGHITDMRFVEVKTTRAAKPKLGMTRYGGTQMSRKWLSENLRRMRHSGDGHLKRLALEVSRFRKSSGRPIESLGEVVHINTKSGMVTAYSGTGMKVTYKQSMERLLTNVQKRATSPNARRMATRSLAQLDQIHAQNMSSWLGTSVSQQSRKTVLKMTGRGLAAATTKAALRNSRAILARKLLLRSAGPIGAAIGFAMDAQEFVTIEYNYQVGLVSKRQRNIHHVTAAGGWAGATGGASAGAAAGAWVGAFGGPAAWITVPAGALVGGASGGIGGYLGGSAVAGYSVNAWYSSIDDSVRETFEAKWLSTSGSGMVGLPAL